MAKPRRLVREQGQLQDGHPKLAGGCRELNFEEEMFPNVTPSCKATGKPSKPPGPGGCGSHGDMGFLCRRRGVRPPEHCRLSPPLWLTPRVQDAAGNAEARVSHPPASALAGFKEGFRLEEVADLTGLPRTCAGSGWGRRWDELGRLSWAYWFGPSGAGGSDAGQTAPSTAQLYGRAPRIKPWKRLSCFSHPYASRGGLSYRGLARSQHGVHGGHPCREEIGADRAAQVSGGD